MDMAVFLQKDRNFSSVHKIGAAISGPKIADTKFTDIVAENGPFGTPFFDPKINPEKFMWSLLHPFPGNEAHKLFLAAQARVFWVGAKSLCWKSLCAFSVP